MDEPIRNRLQSRFSPPPSQGPTLAFDYDPVCGRLLVTAAGGGFAMFHGVPIDAYVRLRFAPAPERYLRDRLMPEFAYVCSSARWPNT